MRIATHRLLKIDYSIKNVLSVFVAAPLVSYRIIIIIIIIIIVRASIILSEQQQVTKQQQQQQVLSFAN